jgi:hypothetical protein
MIPHFPAQDMKTKSLAKALQSCSSKLDKNVYTSTIISFKFLTWHS